jgi:hypothetical protein
MYLVLSDPFQQLISSARLFVYTSSITPNIKRISKEQKQKQQKKKNSFEIINFCCFLLSRSTSFLVSKHVNPYFRNLVRPNLCRYTVGNCKKSDMFCF